MFDDQAGMLKGTGAGHGGNDRSPDHDAQGTGWQADMSGYPLSLARDNDQLLITSMHGGRHYRRQLMDLGLRPGLQVRVMRGGGRGPVLISVGETRLGLGRSVAEKIEVIPASDDHSSLNGGN